MQAENALILIVEDDKSMASLTARALTTQGFACTVANTGSMALHLIETLNPAVILLDLGLPDMDGGEIIRTVRSWNNVPIIIMSARGEDSDKIIALDTGADDYLVKPFSVDELLARIRAALRRSNINQQATKLQSGYFSNGPLYIDYAGRVVSISGKELALSPTEYKLLCLLARHVGKVLTHKTILEEIWGNDVEQSLSSLRVFMAVLRKKIETIDPQCRCLKTHVGVGYRMLLLQDN